MSKYFTINSESKIYVLCPANLKTGGTELLHQLVYALNSIGRTATITYYFEGKYDRSNPTPDEFKKYLQQKPLTFDEITDNENNVLVFPEVCIGKQKRFKKIQKCVWWLSVDNFNETKGKINRLKKYGVLSFLKHLIINDYVENNDVKSIKVHLYQSYFALDFVKSLGIEENRTAYLSDYLNDIYTKNELYNNRDDIVIYNPKKGADFTKKVIEFDKSIEYIPIINMTNIQVFNLMHRAKIYIDFGNHPGKDRIPREAAMCGCCIITGTRGSAGYKKDVNIPNEYKFQDREQSIPMIVDQIKNCLVDFDSKQKEFDDYRVIISKEKKQFIQSVQEIFNV